MNRRSQPSRVKLNTRMSRTNQRKSSRRPPRSHQVKYTQTARHRNKKYRLLPIVFLGLIVALLSALLLSMLYALYCYLAAKNGNVSVIAPTVIYFVIILLASALMTYMIKGRSLLPCLLIGLLFFCYSIGYSIAAFGIENIKISSILIKLLISAVAAVGGYFIAAVGSLLLQGRRKRKRQRIPSDRSSGEQ